MAYLGAIKMTINATWNFTNNEKKIILSLVEKGDEEEKRNKKFAIIDFDSLYRLYNAEEIFIIKKYLSIDPSKLGYKLPYLGVEETPKDIVAIANQAYILNGSKNTIPYRYLPQATYAAYKKMNAVMSHEIGTNLLVSHGYRSPACQVAKFFNTLVKKYDYDFTKTVARVCFPGYSEHGCTKQQAIDFITKNGIKGEAFDKTPEHQWLQVNAGRFNFFQSYPKNNKMGMMYEPWHWRHEQPV